MRIADGTPEDHPTPLPIDATHTPGVANVVVPDVGGAAGRPASTAPGRDCTGERLEQLAAATAGITASMSFGETADAARRQHYLAAMNPSGASTGTDVMSLPPVPEQNILAVSPLYSQGDQPGA